MKKAIGVLVAALLTVLVVSSSATASVMTVDEKLEATKAEIAVKQLRKYFKWG